jgi:hypothetical protein
LSYTVHEILAEWAQQQRQQGQEVHDHASAECGSIGRQSS